MKNTLVGRDRHRVLDFEVAHCGNPVFDLGFFLSFVVLSAVRWPVLAPELRDLADGFAWAYSAAAGERFAGDNAEIRRRPTASCSPARTASLPPRFSTVRRGVAPAAGVEPCLRPIASRRQPPLHIPRRPRRRGRAPPGRNRRPGALRARCETRRLRLRRTRPRLGQTRPARTAVGAASARPARAGQARIRPQRPPEPGQEARSRNDEAAS